MNFRVSIESVLNVTITKGMLTPQNCVALFFGCYFLIGILVVRDYGISTDEPIQRKHGIVSLEYANKKLGSPFDIPSLYDIDINQYVHRDYGVLFQMICYSLELVLDLQTTSSILSLRHYMVFFTFFVGSFFLYKLLKYRFSSSAIAIIGVLLLVLSPRIFANAFYNPKDIPLLSFVVISGYTMIRIIDSHSLKNIALHALASSVAINSRVVAIYIPALTVLFLFMEWMTSQTRRTDLLMYCTAIVNYLLLLSLMTVALWPLLWTNTISNFAHSINTMSNYNWIGSIFFMGGFVNSNNLPWYYILVWIGISTPLLYVLMFLLGSLITLTNVRFTHTKSRIDLVVLLLFVTPLICVIVLNSTLYNGWRHLFFVYPFLIYLCVLGLTRSLELLGMTRVYFKHIIHGLFGTYIIFIAFKMLMLHPYENVYFNELVPRGVAEKNFDLDYYGLSFYQGIEFVLQHSDDNPVKVSYSSFLGKNNEYILSPEKQTRIRSLVPDSSRYFITNYRKAPYVMEQVKNKIFPYNQRLIHTIVVEGNTILGVYEMSHDKNSTR